MDTIVVYLRFYDLLVNASEVLQSIKKPTPRVVEVFPRLFLSQEEAIKLVGTAIQSVQSSGIAMRSFDLIASKSIQELGRMMLLVPSLDKTAGGGERAIADYLRSLLRLATEVGMEFKQDPLMDESSWAVVEWLYRALLQYLQAILEVGLEEPSTRLLVYGLLAPGRANHSVIVDVKGEWTDIWVKGELLTHGTGSRLFWNQNGTRHKAHLLSSGELPRYWQALDEFEDRFGFRRTLILAEDRSGDLIVTNMYEAFEEGEVSPE